MSNEQQRQLDAILRQGGLDTSADVPTLRAAFSELMAQVPVAPDVQQDPVEIGGVAGLEVTIQGNDAENVSSISAHLTRLTETVAARHRDRIGFIQLLRFQTRIEMETQ